MLSELTKLLSMAPANKNSGTRQEAMNGIEAFPEKHTDPEADITDDNNNQNSNNTNSSNPTISNALLLDTEDCATECSSSFETTTYDALDVSGISDTEVESTTLDGLIHPRKKKMTKHWRKYIGPLMWRCKWTELRMMEIQSQGMNCARELALYNKQNLWESDPDALESIGSRSYPYFRQYPANKVMKRRKRRKVEDIIDVTSFISQHNLFSFIENDNRDRDGFTTAVDVVNTVNMNKKVHCSYQFGIDDAPSLVARDWNSGVQGLFEKLERVQSRVHKLRTQLENVMSEHVAKFSSSEDFSLFAPFDGQFSSNHSPNFSVGGIYPPIESISDFDFEDLGFPDSAVSKFEEAINIDGIMESTVAELPAADAPSNHLQNMDRDQKMADDAPVNISVVKAEKPSSDSTQVPHQQPTEETQNVPRTTQLAPDHDIKVAVPGPSSLESSLVSDFTPKNKRKRGERKVGSGSWIKRYAVSDGE